MLIRIFVVALTALVVYGEKPKAETDTHKQTTAPVAQPTDSTTGGPITVVNQEHTEGESNGHAKKPPSYLCRLLAPALIPTDALVLVGIAGIIAAILTLRAIKRQADIMERQTAILETSVKAANASAKAAQDNIELFISKERARLTVEPLDYSIPQGRALSILLYKVAFYGSTPAFIVESVADIEVAERFEGRFNSERVRPMSGLPEIITSDNILKPLQIVVALTQEDMERIIIGKLRVHLWGFIRYKDIFDRERNTPFHFRWQVGIPMFGEIGGQWLKCGPEEDNRAT